LTFRFVAGVLKWDQLLVSHSYPEWNLGEPMMFTACLAFAFPKPERSIRSSGLIRNSYLLSKQMIIDNSSLGLAKTQDERFTPFLVIKIKGNDLTFGLGIIILQGVSSRKSLAGVNIMAIYCSPKTLSTSVINLFFPRNFHKIAHLV
jgi:hypothetical protein